MYGRRPRCKRNLTISEAFGCGHVWTAPAVQEESDYQRSVRVRSCIRPLSAAVWPLALMRSADRSQTDSRVLSSHDPKTGFPIDVLDRFASMSSSPLQFVNAVTSPLLFLPDPL